MLHSQAVMMSQTTVKNLSKVPYDTLPWGSRDDLDVAKHMLFSHTANLYELARVLVKLGVVASDLANSVRAQQIRQLTAAPFHLQDAQTEINKRIKQLDAKGV